MRTIQIKRKFFVSELEEMPINYRELLLTARQVKVNSQSPYSQFKVGAAVLDINNNVSVGVNVERATYTQTTHAEQNAIDNMVAKYGPTPIKVLAIDTINGDKKLSIDDLSTGDLVFPCGHCRQIIWENCLATSVIVVSYISDDLVAFANISSLLPVAFGPKNLGINIFIKND